MSAVTFGKRTRLRFTAGGTLEQWQSPQAGPALYALTYKQDAARRPKAHTVVYFGETADISLPSIRVELINWWKQNCDNRGELFFFFHPLPGSSQYDRTQVQHQLVREYEPQGNN